MHYLIYIPGVRTADPKHLEDVGLPDHAAGADFLESQGPDGKSGSICAWRNERGPMAMHYKPTEQIWIPAVKNGDYERGRYYVGIWNDKPPTPEDVVRPYPYRGRTLELGDGQQWLIPYAIEIPSNGRLDDDGSVKFVIQRRYHAFWLESIHWGMKALTGESYLLPDAWWFVTRALSLNYRLVPEVVSHLELLSNKNICQAVLAVLGGPEDGR